MAITDTISKYIKINSSYWKYLLLLIFLSWVAVMYSRKINFMVSDVGRHIKNGEIFFKEHKILSTNYYSYTNPDYLFPTHHWGVGVFYYIIWKTSGFKGLSIFNTLLMVLALFFFFKSAERLADFKFAFLFSLLIVPLLMFRVEVRPENFSYFFSGIAFYMLVKYELSEIRFKWLFLILFIIQILWVNIHIFFVFNFAFVGAFWLQNLINHKFVKNHTILLGALILASIISPFHIKALLEPFTIFKNFDMHVTENSPILLLENGHLFQNMYFFYFKLIFFIAIVSLTLVVIKKKIKPIVIYLLLLLFFSILTWKMNRFVSIFGLVMIPILTLNHRIIVDNYTTRIQTILYCMISFVIINFFMSHSFNMVKMAGLGIENEKMNNAAYYFRRNNLSGPIMNNMNIGSYLIFHLFPKEKIFYDARPEAYPATFVRDIYQPMMQDREKWRTVMERYNFKTIFFYKVIMSDYEKSFLEQRLKDPEWKLVYNDDYAMILLKD